jgi:hypothetical protein
MSYTLKDKLKSIMDKRWDYEIQCDIFEGLSRPELRKIANAYGIDSNLTRLEICKALADILEQKRLLQKKNNRGSKVY